MKIRYAFLNDSCVLIERASVSIADRGLLYGDGLFETIRVLKGKPVRIEKHVERLLAGAEVLGIDLERIADAMGDNVRFLVRSNGLRQARVRFTVTRGSSTYPGISYSAQCNPTVFATAHPLPDTPPRPARVVISTIRRDETSPLSRVKSLNYLPGIVAMAEARKAGADDAILLNTLGMVAEGAVGNLFLVMGKTLVTPSLDQGVLPGTIRAAVIERGGRRRKLGLEIIERAIRPEEIATADEAFFTNAIQLARPICEVDGEKIGTGEFTACQSIREALEA